MKNNVLHAIILVSVIAVSNSHAEVTGNNPVQLVLNTELAIADGQVSTLTPQAGSSEVVLEGSLDNDGAFSQTSGTRGEFNFTSGKAITSWLQNGRNDQVDKEWFQDVKIVFEKVRQNNGYNIAQVDSDKSRIVICRNPVQPICLTFTPFGQSLQPIQSVDDVTYYIMDPVVGKSRPSIMLQFMLHPRGIS